MSEGEWVAFGLTEDEERDWTVLHSGVPEWMRSSIVEWFRALLISNSTLVARRSLNDIEQACHVHLTGTNADGSYEYASQVMPRVAHLPELSLLRVVDYLLSCQTGRSSAVIRMDEILRRSNSRWQVGVRIGGKQGLVDRVPAGVQDAAESVIASTGKAGDLLREAWAYAHQHEPSASDAFARAVRAVETVAIPKVVPRQDGATLGHVIGQMVNDGDWRLCTREDPQSPTGDVVLGLLRTLWKGHRDRHGKPDYSHVTLDEARTAVDLAVIVVDLFSADLVKRQPAAI